MADPLIHFCGSEGRVIWYDLTAPSPITGSAVAGIDTWKRRQQSEGKTLPHFESPRDSISGLLLPTKCFVVSNTTIDVSGWFHGSLAANPNVLFRTGRNVVLDLILDKTTRFGIRVAATIESYDDGTSIGGTAATFSMSAWVQSVIENYILLPAAYSP
jgi:hypothetical protein